jgi:hypothetical protein
MLGIVFHAAINKWAERQNLDIYLPDVPADAVPNLIRWISSFPSRLTQFTDTAVPFALSPYGIGLAAACLFLLVLFWLLFRRALKTFRAARDSLLARRKYGRIPVRFLEPPSFSYMDNSPVIGLPYLRGQIAGFEKALACRLVNSGVAKYLWPWDRILHRWYFRATKDSRIRFLRMP